MLPLRYSWRWRAAGFFLLLIVLVGTLMPAVWLLDDSQEFVTWFMGFDKWLHLFTFMFLAVWFAGQYERRSYWLIAAGLILFGVLIEVCQRMVSYRSAEWHDLAADVAGVIAGLAIALLGMGGWSLRAEAWLTQRQARD